MDNSAMLSIIVPVYKVESYLPGCIDSILAQTFSDFELILVDDGSPDRCGEICDDYAARDSRIRVIHKENGGLSSARNAGIDAAQGEWLAFVDSDDAVEQQCYEWLMDCAARNQVKMVVAGRWDIRQTTGEKIPGLCPEKEEVVSGAELAKRIFTWNHMDSAAWDKMYRAELFRGIRYPLGVICEDVPTTYRLALKAGKVALCPHRVYRYLHRKGSITYSDFSPKRFHFSKHAHAILASCRADWPELEQSARYLNAWGLEYTLKHLSLASAEDQKKYAPEGKELRRELTREIPFLLSSEFMSVKDKRDAVLLAAGIYTPLRKIHAACKRRNHSK